MNDVFSSSARCGAVILCIHDSCIAAVLWGEGVNIVISIIVESDRLAERTTWF